MMSFPAFIRPSALFFFLLIVIASFNACIEEENTSYETANTVTDGQTVEDIFTDNNARFYSFELSGSCLVKVTVEKSPGRVQFKVFNTSSDDYPVVGTDWIEQGQDIAFWAGPLSAGEHYIVVYPTFRYDSSDLHYKFKIEYDCSDASEFNNSFDKATSLAANSPFEGKLLAVNDYNGYEDVDMYKYEVIDKYAVVKVSFKAPNNIYSYYNNNTIRVGAYDFANENSKLDEMEIEEGQIESMLFGPLAPGTHYVAINYDGQCNCESDDPYTLSVELDYRDSGEPNEGPSTATPMEIDKVYEGLLVSPTFKFEDDQDWYKFTALTGGEYDINLIALQGSSNVSTQAHLYSDANEASYVGSISASNGSTVSWKNAHWGQVVVLSAGQTAYIKVELSNYWYENTESYKMKIVKL